MFRQVILRRGTEMEMKGIIATTHVDGHGEKLAKEALEQLVLEINSENTAIGVSVEHDGLTMPIGKVVNGKLVQLEDGEFAVETLQEIFDIYSTKNEKFNDVYYIAESKTDRRPFAERAMDNINNLTVAIDPHNFNRNDLTVISDFLEKEQIHVEFEIKKSLIPDPELIMNLVVGTLFCWTGKKTIEKLSDDIASDISGLYSKIKKIIIKFAQYSTPQNRPKTYRFREQEEYVKELVIQTSDPNIVIEALQPDKLNKIESVIEKNLEQFNVSPARVQLIYEIDKKEWKLNYLLTASGQAIGTEKCYKRTVDLINQLEFQEGHINVSVAGLVPTTSALKD